MRKFLPTVICLALASAFMYALHKDNLFLIAFLGTAGWLYAAYCEHILMDGGEKDA